MSAPAWCQRAPEHATCAKVGHRSPILRAAPLAVQLVEARSAGADRPRMVFLDVTDGAVHLSFLITLDAAGKVRDALTQVTAWAGETA
ncbi:hypothetical protein [Phytohabitans kaempferiae]|uniref:Uncharacterized protein n=1 Tax=Phytohabitans kaempferiae TaxID=1620943 RepID=A0ABV6LZY2_9ACTN